MRKIWDNINLKNKSNFARLLPFLDIALPQSTVLQASDLEGCLAMLIFFISLPSAECSVDRFLKHLVADFLNLERDRTAEQIGRCGFYLFIANLSIVRPNHLSPNIHTYSKRAWSKSEGLTSCFLHFGSPAHREVSDSPIPYTSMGLATICIARFLQPGGVSFLQVHSVFGFVKCTD